MKVPFETMITDFDGTVLKMDGKDMTLKSLSVAALGAQFPDERDLKGEEKIKRFDLALRIYQGVDDLKVEEIALIKSLVAKAFSVVVVGRAWKLLEGEAA